RRARDLRARLSRRRAADGAGGRRPDPAARANHPRTLPRSGDLDHAADPRRRRAQPAFALVLEAIAGLEEPPNGGEAGREEERDRGEADEDVDVGDAVEAPAEAADEID